VIGSDGEAIFYGVLDILAKPVFGAILLWGHRNIDPRRLGLHIRDYDDEIIHHEKSDKSGAINTAATTTTTPTQHNVVDNTTASTVI
jgi:bacteriorhodopsin